MSFDPWTLKNNRGVVNGLYKGHYFWLEGEDESHYTVEINMRDGRKPPEEVLITGEPISTRSHAYMARIPKDAPELYFIEPIERHATYKGREVKVRRKVNDHYVVDIHSYDDIPADFMGHQYRVDRFIWEGDILLDDPDLKFIDE